MIITCYEKIERFIFRILQDNYEILSVEYINQYMKNLKLILEKDDNDILILRCKIKPISEEDWINMKNIFLNRFDLV